MMLRGGGARTDRALDRRVVDADHRVSVNEAVGEQLAALFLQELAVIEHNEVDSPAGSGKQLDHLDGKDRVGPDLAACCMLHAAFCSLYVMLQGS